MRRMLLPFWRSRVRRRLKERSQPPAGARVYRASGKMDLEKKSIERIKIASEMSLHHYGQPLVCTYSGGKDSDVMLELFKRSGVPFEVHHSHTTADAPYTVYHVRKVFRELEIQGIKCTIDYHKQPDGSRTTMWNLIPRKKTPPTRLTRYCCSVLKETGCANRMIATGVRWAESRKRKSRSEFEAIGKTQKEAIGVTEKMLLSDCDESRKLFEKCELKAKTVVNPIIDWKNADVYEFYWNECRHHNPLYKMGYDRVGCIGCPMAGKGRWKEFADFPTYQRAYINAFDKILEKMRNDGTGRVPKWKNGYEVFLWWIEDDNVAGQMSIFDFPEAMP